MKSLQHFDEQGGRFVSLIAEQQQPGLHFQSSAATSPELGPAKLQPLPLQVAAAGTLLPAAVQALAPQHGAPAAGAAQEAVLLLGAVAVLLL